MALIRRDWKKATCTKLWTTRHIANSLFAIHYVKNMSMYASMYAYTNTNVVYLFWWSSYFIKHIYRFRFRLCIYNFRCIPTCCVLTVLFFILFRFDIWPLSCPRLVLGWEEFLCCPEAGGVFFHRHSFCWNLGGQMFGDYTDYTLCFGWCFFLGVAAFGWWFVDDDGDVDVGDEIMISFEGDEVVAGADGRDDDEYQLQPAVVAMHVPVKRTDRLQWKNLWPPIINNDHEDFESTTYSIKMPSWGVTV